VSHHPLITQPVRTGHPNDDETEERKACMFVMTRQRTAGAAIVESRP
jgi:hypothetical protein